MQLMRIVVVGAGRMGVIRAEDLAADGRVDEIVITNRNPERAAELAARVGGSIAPWPTDTTDPNAWPIADGYAVTTTTDTHADIIGALASLGRPLLIEKPLAMSLEETDRIIDLSGDVTMQIGFQRRFDAGIRAIKDAIDSGRLGVLYTMTLTAHDMTPGSPDYIAGSGGTFRDMLVHDLDLARWLSGSEIATVYATGHVRDNPDYAAANDHDVVAVHLTMANGVPILISGTRHDPVGHDIRMEAFGSLDSISAGLNHRTPIHLADGDLNVDADPYGGFMDRFRAAFTAETSAFVDVVRGERDNPCPPEASRAALAAAVACEISAREGRVVDMTEIG
ncbi:MAG: Gfo/Idh/MocA family oxidoreductase [Candidatus Nanopelagicales bacterium]|jgi:myo-inositol 2-dehydrogenase / D-chiro-inositol 1-dehydrogenase|nr:Gfo/Idh/MocA family oxidoreductase [Candidatus Nanopelagicales bacterium]MDP4714721.1 Gfo/Idh/MocA family oxidoreductase [Candidatus Nanopelagicales bacterium]MDP4905654.1 Gfo/Idh/MocA family oxidoreductase [Candidatus Nanopelagicales bacterium]MDP4975592.1 Gfo/Idh/MocA family oxidoreductase [Candidatus Nanopelagicales bacterium]MDP5095497.1 Gfo/Idh/MocA family oxidoreductase [Candidatus Nanopelagicales bacterium]